MCVCVCVVIFFNMFCIFAKNIDCGPHKAVLTSTHNDAQSMFWSKNKKKKKGLLYKIGIRI